ncbi:hypothetical protein HELRODRAFT_73737 [Helobdella robusta]|uniref:4-hydroxybenzoate polyprenyltransferase, mitochondrial n=1 Tax=Helobdella robusta TaxID=6412 RepID=T1G1H8_HELRO|nr:hypothetical protein HELRODRAFT_73737 [Helobdella robusta]ESO09218.1 hypothetical protein HELRODRAFT_73737 [Helobdella robusta]
MSRQKLKFFCDAASVQFSLGCTSHRNFKLLIPLQPAVINVNLNTKPSFVLSNSTRHPLCVPLSSTISQRFLHVNNQKRNPDLTILSEADHQSLAVRFVSACPEPVQPYLRLMRIDRPIGTWLVFLPCAWSITLASPAGQLPDLKTLILFGLGSFFMRGAGCIINDMWDKDFDSKVERTKLRPIANNQVTRFKALCFLSIPLSISFSILLTFNWNTIGLGVCSLAPCVIYPLAKRFTYWPQAFLGITQGWGILIAWSEIYGSLTWPTLALYTSGVFWTMTYDTIYSCQVFALLCLCYLICLVFNWGAVMGWSAVCNTFQWAMVSMYITSIAWTLLYDTIYAFQDIEDDLKVGVKSTAIKFGESTKYWLAGFGSIVVGGLTTTGILCDQPWLYYLGVAGFAAHLSHQVWSVNLKDGNQCGEKFRSNRNLGLIFWGIIVLSNLIKIQTDESEVSDNQTPQKNVNS